MPRVAVTSIEPAARTRPATASTGRARSAAGERRAARHLRAIQVKQVSGVMRRHPPAMRVSSRCEHAAEVMADHHVAVLSVTDGEGRVVGVLTRRALLEARWAGRLC